MNLENIVNDIGLVDFMFASIFIGYVICMIHDILFSFINYIYEKAWRVSDYERIIYMLNEKNDTLFLNLNFEEKEVYFTAIDRYKSKLNKRDNLQKLKNKIANLFKKKK